MTEGLVIDVLYDENKVYVMTKNNKVIVATVKKQGNINKIASLKILDVEGLG